MNGTDDRQPFYGFADEPILFKEDAVPVSGVETERGRIVVFNDGSLGYEFLG